MGESHLVRCGLLNSRAPERPEKNNRPVAGAGHWRVATTDRTETLIREEEKKNNNSDQNNYI